MEVTYIAVKRGAIRSPETKVTGLQITSFIKRFVSGAFLFSPLFTDRIDDVPAWLIVQSDRLYMFYSSFLTESVIK